MSGTRRWKFFRAGGFDQVLLESGEDLFALAQLDKKLWSALSCPVQGVEFDRRTLQLIDSDNDGQIRVPEILEAIRWGRSCLTDVSPFDPDADGIPLAALNVGVDEGARLADAVRTVLVNLGKPDADRVTVADVCDNEAMLAATRFNGDGVITEATAESEDLKAWIRDVIACCGSLPDRSGVEGINSDLVDRFAAAATAWSLWHDAKPADDALPAGDERESLMLLYRQLKPKIEDFFLRCGIASYDQRGAGLMNSPEESLQRLAASDLSTAHDEMAALPLAEVTAAGILDTDKGVNPAWHQLLVQFNAAIVQPLTGDTHLLSLKQWEEVKSSLEIHEKWLLDQPEPIVAQLGIERLRQWESDSVANKLHALIDQDLLLKPAFDAMLDLERLTRYCRDLLLFANNYVSFRDFYTGKGKAIFQAGTLYMDGRSFDLCIRVTDIAKHALLANLSGIYLAYCDCVRNGAKMTISAAVTNGDCDQLMIGRNGVFFDREGNDWDATIVRILDHPISLRQAFWSPYKRVVRMVGEQVQKMAAARAKAVEDKTAAGVMQSGTKKEEAKPGQQAFDVGKFAGIFAAVGLAAGALATAIAAIVTGFFKLSWWQMPLAVIGIALLISGPSMLLAWFKLRQRNLGRLLDANGWAVNTRARINIPFGASLTSLARLPEGSVQQLVDPFAEKKGTWKGWLLLLILVALALLLQRCSWAVSFFSA